MLRPPPHSDAPWPPDNDVGALRMSGALHPLGVVQIVTHSPLQTLPATPEPEPALSPRPDFVDGAEIEDCLFLDVEIGDVRAFYATEGEVS